MAYFRGRSSSELGEVAAFPSQASAFTANGALTCSVSAGVQLLL